MFHFEFASYVKKRAGYSQKQIPIWLTNARTIQPNRAIDRTTNSTSSILQSTIKPAVHLFIAR